MPKKIDWLYHRKNCVTCAKAEACRTEVGATAKEVVPATTKFDGPQSLAMLEGLTKLVVAKGTKVVEFDLKKDRPDDETLLAHLLGPYGNLRAPAMRVGKTFVVGFHPDVYAKVLG